MGVVQSYEPTEPRATMSRWALAQEGGTILLASDGSSVARSALRLGTALARRWKVSPVVVSALPSLPYPVPPIDTPISFVPSDSLEIRRHDWRRREIENQVRAVGGSLLWPIVVDPGDAVSVISERAKVLEASMIIMGLREHGTLDRLLRDETTLRVMQRAGAPVVGVTTSLRGLPTRAVAAVDFSRASLRAARIALALLADRGTLSLVFVRPDSEPLPEDLEGRNVIFTQGVKAAFGRLQKELDPPRGIRLETVLLEGAPAGELASFAERSQADLIAVGSHRRSLLNRVLLGSVAADLVRRASCSMLVTPPV